MKNPNLPLYTSHGAAASINDIATGFLLNHLIHDDPILHHFEYLTPFISDQRPIRYLSSTISPIGLASLLHSRRDNHLMKSAYREDSSALELTNIALRSPTELTKDRTMVAVMLLGVFEATLRQELNLES